MDGENVVSSYTAGQAEEDGELVNVTALAKEAGYKWPVRVTRNLYSTWIEVSETLEALRLGQSLRGRLWDVLNVMRYALKKAEAGDMGPIAFTVEFTNDRGKQEDVKLWVCVDGTEGIPALHIMLPEDY